MIVALGVVLAIIILTVVFVLLFRKRLNEKYAILWLVIGIGVLILGLFPGLLFALTDFLGVEVPSNLLFALAVVLLLGVTLHHSWELSRIEEESRRLAEEVAILRADIEGTRAGDAVPPTRPDGDASTMPQGMLGPDGDPHE